jgi:hypothetical protein
VLWIAERADGKREIWETLCDNAPAAASDREILSTLAHEMRELFADRGVIRFAVAYLANKSTRSAPVEPTPLMPPATWSRPVIMLEVHSAEEHWRADREIIQQARRHVLLAALSPPEPAPDALYARLLQPAREPAT